MVYDYIRLRVSALFEIHGREHGVGEREQKPARRHENPLLCKGIIEHRDRADGKGHEQKKGIDADYRSELAELELEQLFADDNISYGDNDRDYYRQDSREHAPVAGEFTRRTRKMTTAAMPAASAAQKIRRTDEGE